MTIDATVEADLAALETLYSDAFPDEDLWPLTQRLLAASDVLSLGAYATDGTLVGHVCLTLCGLQDGPGRIGLLGPLGVLNAWQGQGIGSALVAACVEQLPSLETSQINLLGDPGYYGRFGFQVDADLAPPYPLTPEWCAAWQVLRVPQDAPVRRGRLRVPPMWRDPVLWAP